MRQQQLLQKYEEWKPKFPAVQGISAQRLFEMIEEDGKQAGPGKLVLVDTRTPQEQEVSMIPSRCTLTQQEFESRLADLQDSTVVVYCTAGYRSGVYAAKLLAGGRFQPGQVLNLEGSILAWSLLGLPLVRKQASKQGASEVLTRQVHTCLPEWSKYLGNDHEAVTALGWMSKLRLLVWAVSGRRL